ncbi:MAG: LamG domain-containing protein [Rickettsiales bacterium]|nr:LamG domain-containing protein [Rickettsiales bacterium]
MKKLLAVSCFLWALPALAADPAFTNLSVKNRILNIIGSDFPYSPISSYVTSDRLLHLDAIDNTGAGDMNHSYATTTWTDLSGNANNISGMVGILNWSVQSLKIGGSDGIIYAPTIKLQPQYDDGKTLTKMTYEYIFSGNSYIANAGINSIDTDPFDKSINNCFWKQTSNSGGNITWQWTDKGNIRRATVSIPDDGKIHAVSVSLDMTVQTNGLLKFYVDGVYQTSASTNSNTGYSSGFTLGRSFQDDFPAPNVKLHSVRIYNTNLTDAQLMNNFTVDSIRFLAPPVIKIGNAVCGEVSVLSSGAISCMVPASVVAGEYEVTYTENGTVFTVGKCTYDGQNCIDVNFNYSNIAKSGKLMKAIYRGGSKVKAVFKNGVQIFSE